MTAVGGTSLGVGACNQYLFETGWGTGRSVLDGAVWAPDPPGDWWYGGGGGTSVLYGQPWYQHRVVPTSIADYFMYYFLALNNPDDEVQSWIEKGDEKAIKEAGLMRQEGKEYVMADGDIVHFKFNV